ncbi:MAG TPA: hypothetical protein P5060_02330 [Candidatus Absconditabacterales bacterium]|nr:hypothetical protein [Candidatus Absconditabacterales bacterium]
MTEENIIGEADFQIVDEDELQKIKDKDNLKKESNLRDDLIELGFLDYDSLSEEEKIIFDEMKKEKRDQDFYEL